MLLAGLAGTVRKRALSTGRPSLLWLRKAIARLLFEVLGSDQTGSIDVESVIAQVRRGPMTHDDKPASDEALQASEQQSWRQFGRAPVGLMTASLAADRGCVCVAANETCCELSGCSRAEISGVNLLSFFHPEDQPALDLLIEDVLAGATDQIGAHARLIRKDGDTVGVRLTGSVIRPPAGERYLAAFIEDATALQQARADIQRLEAGLQGARRPGGRGQTGGGNSH